MSEVTKRLATDETLTAVKNAIAALPNATQAAADAANAAAESANNIVATIDDIIGSIDDTVFDLSAVLSPDATEDNYRIIEETGICVSDSTYTLKKYAVKAGNLVKITTNGLCQFQSSYNVPGSLPSNRIGKTYKAGAYVLKAPTGARCIIVSVPKTGGVSNVQDAFENVTSANNSFSITSGTAHSSENDTVHIKIKNGEKFYVTVLGVDGTVFAVVSNPLRTSHVYLDTRRTGLERHEFTAEEDIYEIGIYVPSPTITGKVTFIIETKDSQLQFPYVWNDFYTSMSCFLRVGVVGDSFASGWLRLGGNVHEAYDISWIQQMAREYGFTGVNFSQGGEYAKKWLIPTNNWGVKKLYEEDPCDLYYIMLGINDKNRIPSIDTNPNTQQPLGTIDDCPDTLSDTEINSFYGNMGRIILKIKDRAEHAKIILSTMARNDSQAEIDFNNAIIAIAKKYGVRYIVQKNDPFFLSSFYLDNTSNHDYHPTVQLYGGMSKAIARLTNKCMVSNPTYFNDIWPSSLLT